jgi:chemotaxis signal transduction protein/hemoglobin-like flavoprotein
MATQQKGRRQLVVTRVGDTDCGIDIGAVLEILPAQPVTLIPGAPANVLGMLNVRGGIVPIADLRRCLGFPARPFTSSTRFVLVTYRSERVGLVVDAVTEVMTLEDHVFQSMAGTIGDAAALRAVAKVEGRIILDIDHEVAVDQGLAGGVGAWYQSVGWTDESAPGADGGGLNVELLETSFNLLAPRGDELVARFYDNLFAAAPGVRSMFAEDLSGQRRALLGALGMIVKSLRSPEKLVDYLSGLGERHAALGALAPHYDVVGNVLLATMAELAGDLWTPELNTAWTDAYVAVRDIMLDAAAKAQSKAA